MAKRRTAKSVMATFTDLQIANALVRMKILTPTVALETLLKDRKKRRK